MRRSSLGRRCFTYFLVLWVAAAWNGPLFAAAATVEQETARASKYVTQLQRSLMAIEDGRREAPRDRWDPQYVVDTVGIDPAKLYGFVRDNVGWVPYRGTLRGPVGVLMDRRGNALDQSLLLAKLLSLAGHETRLARAELPETAAGSLWASLAASASVGPETIANNAGGVPAPAETGGNSFGSSRRSCTRLTRRARGAGFKQRPTLWRDAGGFFERRTDRACRSL